MRRLKLSFIFLILLAEVGRAAEVAITMDDPTVQETPILSASERNVKILEALRKHGDVKAVLFVCGMRIDSQEGHDLIQKWDRQGHWIANHTYSHWNYHSQKISYDDFSGDFLKVEPLISGFQNFRKLFRFPMLKEGNNQEKREKMRSLLNSHGYDEGYVTIDASDWYIDERMIDRLKKDPKADLSGYRSFYLNHIWARAQYYDNLAQKVLGHSIKHTLLIHHSLLNALFLNDLLQMFEDKGWKIVDASLAYQDPIFKLRPNILPAGESIVWALAKESGKFDSQLRYPGEDGEYEKEKMDMLGL